jgi:cell division protein FtsB
MVRDKADMMEAQPEVYKVLKVMQAGLQYLLYTQDYLKTHCDQAQQSLVDETKHLDSLALQAKRQRAKQRKLRRELEELDARSYHLDLLNEVAKSDGSTQLGQVVTKLRQAADPQVFDRLHEKLKVQASKLKEARPDELLESDFELSASHPADSRAGRREEVKGPQIDLPMEERYSKFNSPGLQYFAEKPQ